MKKYQTILVLGLWGALALWAWFIPSKQISEAERRPLAQKPAFSDTFTTDFESYSLDQFPLRDSFRTLKSLFHTVVLGQRDNNGIYLTDGTAVKQEYPLNADSVNHAIGRFQKIYDKYLTESRCFYAIVPDKGYYLGEESEHLTMDYDTLYAQAAAGMPWAEEIDLRPVLSGADYYRTDTHWRQESLIPAAAALCEGLGVTPPKAEDFAMTPLERPFYGVYYGQAALPMEPDTLYLMANDLLARCTVYDYETEKTGSVYDLTKLGSRDLYDVYLSGAKALLTIENPGAKTDRELVIFRDSFGSSMAPLLVSDYAKVTLVDIRYVQPELLEQFLDFHGQDVLFLYSTLVLNSSAALK
ncbi:MAG: DHHW family protein [Eubacteriales bacterium]|nr:DHHW family protein [Eubacteriales bacterium]